MRWTLLAFLPLGLMLVACQAGPETATRTVTDGKETRMSQQDTLAGSAWWVEDIDHGGVVDRSHTTLHFVDGSQVAGDSACNRYRGTVEIGEESLQFGAIAGTRRACVPAIADQEQRYYAALSRVVAWEIADTGLLHLLDADGTSIIRASRISPNEA